MQQTLGLVVGPPTGMKEMSQLPSVILNGKVAAAGWIPRYGDSRPGRLRVNYAFRVFNNPDACRPALWAQHLRP
jgi:hypothetical protein